MTATLEPPPRPDELAALRPDLFPLPSRAFMTPDRPISELFAQKRPLRSLEFFPPKDEAGVEALRGAATALKRMNPDFVSVTYGAGGTTRDRTAQVSAMLKYEFGFTVMPHLTCVGHTRTELEAIADRIYG